MKTFHTKILLFVTISILALLAGCSSSETSNGSQEEKTIKIGVTGGPPEEITNIVKEVAKEEGINLEVIKFNDWITPNVSLANGELDLNMFQAKQFLEQFVEDRKENIVPIGTTYNSTLGIYSEKYENIDEIPDGATIGIQNDPVNMWRALLNLEDAGLIKVDPNVEKLATIKDIVENPKQLKFKEIDGTMILSTLGSLDAGVAGNTNAYNMGINPSEKALYIETSRDFPMVVAAREEDKDSANYKKIVELYHSDEVKEYIEKNYKEIIVVTDNPFEIE